ncbi:protein CHUP1, chloroplastic-like [Sesamum indicum]|uniref:Protein CHUP1, chloroplastic-like n=1 Tax=Sesamum indicum TaxID=4182 RepID=A0A6I9UQ18_SESIN|nr:protein CHUP1, chloroplastic-like [Sesamum indicum]
MREENPSENRVKSSKFADQNQVPKDNNHRNVKGNSNFSRMKSSWGSHIVKGFSAADKKSKTRVLQATAQSKKLPLNNSDTSNQKNQPLVSNSRIKRSLIGDLSCSINATQVHPQTVQSQNKTKPSGSSEDLFLEIDHLRNLLQESKDRELSLQAELSEYKRNPKVLEVERELELKKSEIDGLLKRVGCLENEKANLSGQLVSLASVMGKHEDVLESEVRDSFSSVEMEVLELRRLNKELQLQKRNLSGRISSLESQLATLAKVSESDIVEKIKAEASLLRHTNEDLCKQVEGLQMSRMNEVEELAYLRWVNSCLRDELRSCSTRISDKSTSPNSVEKSRESICFSSFQMDQDSNDTATKRLYLVKKFKRWPITDEDLHQMKYMDDFVNHNWDDPLGLARRHSISGTNCCPDDLILNKKRQSDSFICSKEADKTPEVLVSEKYDLEVSNRPNVYTNSHEVSKMTASLDIEKRTLRIPNPPPRPSCAGLSGPKEETSSRTSPPTLPPPPPPPPPPPKLMARSMTGTVQRAPQVVEFYHSLMKRESRKDCLNSGTTDASDVANVRSSMIGEIENRSSHLLAIKADVETQGEFVNSLIREVNNAVYQNIEDVLAFVKWLDDELSFLVDERAVLKHFEWPEKKADTLREAAFGYSDLRKLEQEVSIYKDDPRLPCDIALKKMAALSERMERTVHNILRTRDSLMRHCKEFHIPTDWMLDNGILSKIKFGSVKLAKMYMERVAIELQSKGTLDKDSSLDYMLLQGVRFAFRIHQFAGGFDSETMQAFEELRDLAVVLNKSRD